MTIDRVYSLDDHFFHIRFAREFFDHGFAAYNDFQSIYFSKMGETHEYLVYYSFFFHAVLIPFALITPPILGIKVFGVLSLSLSFTVVYLFLRRTEVRAPFLWAVFFLVSLMHSEWLYRLTLARPFALSPVFLIILLACIKEKRYGGIGVIAFLYFYWHTATFFFPLLLAFGYFLFEQFYGRRPDWRVVLAPAFGTFGAVVATALITPGVLPYLKDVIFPVFFDTNIFKSSGIREGNEVYGKDFFTMFSSFFWYVAPLCVFGAYEILRYLGMKRATVAADDMPVSDLQPLRGLLFLTSLMFFAASFMSARFVDYFVYFVLLYLALAAQDLRKFFILQPGLFRQAFVFGCSLVAVVLTAHHALRFHELLAGSRSHLVAEGPAQWLEDHAEPGAVVFNTDWGAFPVLYYFTGSRFRFVNGLEPRFLYDYNERMFWTWTNMGSGVYCESRDCAEVYRARSISLLRDEHKQQWYKEQGDLMADAIQEEFSSRILLLPTNQTALMEVLDHSDRFERAYHNPQNSLYSIYWVWGQNGHIKNVTK